MDTLQIAEAVAGLCRQGKFLEAGETYWADDVLSLEPFTGDMAELRGKAAVKAKGDWWVEANEVHGVEVQEPYINGDQFLIRFVMDMTPKATGKRTTLDEVGLYTVKGGKITHERFFVGRSYFEPG
jgi:hypothetical protein